MVVLDSSMVIAFAAIFALLQRIDILSNFGRGLDGEFACMIQCNRAMLTDHHSAGFPPMAILQNEFLSAGRKYANTKSG